MKIERSKNAFRNIFFGIVLRLYTIFFPFIIRTLMIKFMGIEYLGLNSLFASILQVLNLAELGIGSAMVFSMYAPIANDDDKKICALVNLYRKYYRIIGVIVGLSGIIICPFVPRLIESKSLESLPDGINLYVLYVINLSATVFSYWFFAYKRSLLDAYQRTDISSKITLISNTIMYLFQIISLCIIKDYYCFILSLLFTQLVNNLLTKIIVDKMFPKYLPVGNLSKEERLKINTRIKDLFTAKIGGVIVGSADTIVISTFLGLSVLAIYQNYFFVISSIIGFINVIVNSCIAGIGNSIVVESEEKNFNDLKKFTFIIEWVIGFCCICLVSLFQPFMKLWVGIDLCLDYLSVIFFVLYFYIQETNLILLIYKDAGGIWHKDRFRPLTVALTNLLLNLIFVKHYGLYGVLASTFLATLIIGFPWILHNLFSTLFKKIHLKEYFFRVFYYTIVNFIICCSFGFLANLLNFENLYITLFLRLIVCVCSIFVYICIYKSSREFKWGIGLLKNILFKKGFKEGIEDV